MQLSISEGFPNAICEAMLSGCVPIGSDVAAIPEIIGDTGFILKKRNADMLRELVQKAIGCLELDALSVSARERIASRYPLRKRGELLLEALSG
jgi:glycosyltransferase involved in cell wall biosynthesis